MEFIFIIENDERTQKELFDTLRSINPSLALRFFLCLEDFHLWLKEAMVEGPLSLSPAGKPHSEDKQPVSEPKAEDRLKLIIANNDFLGTKNMSLIRRAQEFFIRKGLCTKENPTSLVLTVFDNPDFDIKLAEDRIINNVIFKPFDKLILKQHLNFALSGGKPLATDDIASFKLSSTLEMLKEVQVESLSEIGFSTYNNHPIQVGALSKYYCDLFQSTNKKSLYAICTSSEKIGEEKYLCHFQYFAAEVPQIQALRKMILEDKAHKDIKIKTASNPNIKILLVEETPHSVVEVESALNIYFENIEFYSYESYAQMLADLADKDTVQRKELPPVFDFILINFQHLEIDTEDKKKQLDKALQDRAEKYKVENPEAKVLLLSRKNLDQEVAKSCASWAQEIFFYPLEKNYMAKKISSVLNLKPKRDLDVKALTTEQCLKVATPVKITQISEAGLIMKYYRPLAVGAFREFILWRPNENENPEIIGTVYYNEKDKTSDAYLNHFVFFGMTDYYLKHLRLWLRDSYIRDKAES